MRAAEDYVAVCYLTVNCTLVTLWEDTFLSDAFIKAYIGFRHVYQLLLRGVLF